MAGFKGRERDPKKTSGKHKVVQGNPNLALKVLHSKVRKRVDEIICNRDKNEQEKSELLERLKQELKKIGLSKTDENAITALQKEITKKNRRQEKRKK